MSKYPKYRPHADPPPRARDLTAEENQALARTVPVQPENWVRACEKCAGLEKRILQLETTIECLTGKPLPRFEEGVE